MLDVMLSWIAKRLQLASERQALKAAAKEAQTNAVYPYCMMGRYRCLDQNCGCVDSKEYRALFIQSWIITNRS